MIHVTKKFSFIYMRYAISRQQIIARNRGGKGELTLKCRLMAVLPLMHIIFFCESLHTSKPLVAAAVLFLHHHVCGRL